MWAFSSFGRIALGYQRGQGGDLAFLGRQARARIDIAIRELDDHAGKVGGNVLQGLHHPFAHVSVNAERACDPVKSGLDCLYSCAAE